MAKKNDDDRTLRASDLVDAAAIAQRLGNVKTVTVHQWRYRHDDFPPPVATFGKALIWNWPDVETWARAHNRLPGSTK